MEPRLKLIYTLETDINILITTPEVNARRDELAAIRSFPVKTEWIKMD